MEHLGPGMSMNYDVNVRRDVPSVWLFWLALLLLLIPPDRSTASRVGAFEGKRWAESDYAPCIQFAEATIDAQSDLYSVRPADARRLQLHDLARHRLQPRQRS